MIVLKSLFIAMAIAILISYPLFGVVFILAYLANTKDLYNNDKDK